jgi:thiamine biosynthesis lipoprotein
MGGPAELQYFAPTRLLALEQQIEAEAKRLEATYSRYQPNSIVSCINNQAGKSAISVDEETAGLIDFAFAAFKQSQGLFDISSGVLRRAWNFSEPRLPEKAMLEKLLELVGLHKISWKRPSLFLPHPGMELDFGGIVKEYAVDRCTTFLKEAKVDGLVNFAGDLRISSSGGSGHVWKVGIVAPRTLGETIATLELRDGAIATSGDYERYIEVDGRRYYHILHPRTGYSVPGFQSVSILASTCSMAGVVSTTAMLLGQKKGINYLHSTGYPYLLVCEGGKLVKKAL